MASFQAKTSWKSLRKREKKSKNTIVASFQAKIGWKRSRKRE